MLVSYVEAQYQAPGREAQAEIEIVGKLGLDGLRNHEKGFKRGRCGIRCRFRLAGAVFSGPM
jgi:hypothetical protein